MSMTDPLADMFTRIRNGSTAKFDKVDMPFSKMKREIARLLKEEGFIRNFKVVTDERRHEQLRIFLKYDGNRKPIIHIRRVSRPGRRVYVRNDRIAPVMGGLGITVLSTPKGILSDKAARQAHAGGEVICHVW
jgi:small subunit ribosomal protein S8